MSPPPLHPPLIKQLLYLLLVSIVTGIPVIFSEKSGFEYAKPVLPFFYFMIFIFIVEFILQIFSKLYNFKVFSIFKHLVYSDQTKEVKTNIFLEIILLFYLTVGGFAILYSDMAYYNPASFKTDQEITFLQATYFSLTALTVGPSGLEPKSNMAHVVVMIEILVGLVYAFLVFSAISSHILQKRP